MKHYQASQAFVLNPFPIVTKLPYKTFSFIFRLHFGNVLFILKWNTWLNICSSPVLIFHPLKLNLVGFFFNLGQFLSSLKLPDICLSKSFSPSYCAAMPCKTTFLYQSWLWYIFSKTLLCTRYFCIPDMVNAESNI